MNKIEKVFKNGKAFIPFITAGDPAMNITRQLILGLAQNGADLIEIGIPFSDPVAEGTVIQKADERSLAAGTTTDSIFSMICEVRKESDIPLALMTYANPIYTYGTERFFENCKKYSIDAVIVPDIPYEEKNEFLPFAKKYEVHFISFIAPTSKERIQKIAKEAEGFLYCVSSLGVTGIRSDISADVGEMVRLVKEESEIPCAVGFGISTPGQAKKMAQVSDGVIVGSAIVRIVEEYGENCIEPVKIFAKEMKKAIS